MLIMQHTFTYTYFFLFIYFFKMALCKENIFPLAQFLYLLYLHLKGIHDYWGMNFYYATPYIIFYFFLDGKNFYYTLHQPLIFLLFFPALNLRYQKYYYISFRRKFTVGKFLWIFFLLNDIFKISIKALNDIKKASYLNNGAI